MPRKPVIRTSEFPYHIRGRSNNREWFHLSPDRCFKIFEDVLIKTTHRYDLELEAFVLMNNHFHMMLRTPKANISESMRYFMTETSRQIRKGSNRINHVYGGRHKATVVCDDSYYSNCLHYIYRNPARAEIVSRVEDYKYSTISKSKNRLMDLIAGTRFDDERTRSPVLFYRWLNTPTSTELEERIRKGLRRSTFQMGVDRKTRTMIGSKN